MKLYHKIILITLGIIGILILLVTIFYFRKEDSSKFIRLRRGILNGR